MNASLGLILALAILVTGQQPDTPDPSTSPVSPTDETYPRAEEGPTEEPPRRPRRRKAPRRRAEPPKKGRKKPEAPAPAPRRRKAPRRRADDVVKLLPPGSRALPRPGLTELNLRTEPLSPVNRALLVFAQTGCSVVGAAGALSAAGGAALVARTVDRPAALLAHPRVPIGGFLPLLTGLTVGTAATAMCVGGLGLMGERRLLGSAFAAAATAGVALTAGGLGTLVVFWPADRTGRNTARREWSMAFTLAGYALTAPLAAMIAWHLGAVLQERMDQRAYDEELDAAKKALAEDALKERQRAERAAAAPPVPPPEPAPPVEEKPAEQKPAEAPQPPPPPAESEPAVPADPLVTPPEFPPVEPVPASPG